MATKNIPPQKCVVFDTLIFVIYDRFQVIYVVCKMNTSDIYQEMYSSICIANQRIDDPNKKNVKI
jgi:hypothetical protein